MEYILFSASHISNLSDWISIIRGKTLYDYERTLRSMRWRKSLNNNRNIIINDIDLCTNVDGKIMELPTNGYLNLTFEMQRKFLMLGNLSLRNENCNNKEYPFGN
jgi:hypothetical protein